jgi:hypothetical protein
MCANEFIAISGPHDSAQFGSGLRPQGICRTVESSTIAKAQMSLEASCLAKTTLPAPKARTISRVQRATVDAVVAGAFGALVSRRYPLAKSRSYPMLFLLDNSWLKANDRPPLPPNNTLTTGYRLARYHRDC